LLNEALLDDLRGWRSAQARERSVPAYVVFTDVTLTAIAEQEPRDSGALLEIPGIGPKKLDAYGDELLAMIERHAG
jgi:DNA helicase-2/ATP-dependent DNA helicase PcrA